MTDTPYPGEQEFDQWGANRSGSRLDQAAAGKTLFSISKVKIGSKPAAQPRARSPIHLAGGVKDPGTGGWH